MKKITVDSAFVLMLLEGAEKQGLNCEQILLRNHISQLALVKPGARVPIDSFASLTIELMQNLGDEFLGLAQRKQPLGSFNMQCHSCITAKTVRHSLKRCSQFWNLFNNTYKHEFQTPSSPNDESLSAYILTPVNDIEPVNDYLVGSQLSSIHRFHCWLGGQFIPIKMVKLSYPKPDYADSYKQLFYGAPVLYEQDDCRLEFNSSLLNLEIVQNSEKLEQYLKSTDLALLYQPKNYRVISDQVRQWLEKNIKQGNYQATLKEAASYFQMSQQVLHRRLQAQNISFKEIKMQTRRDIAINLLFRNDYKIEEIATHVGFSEPSAFIRAFKSWTGVTPLNYRLENRHLKGTDF